MRFVSETPKTVTVTLSRKEARELANVAFGQKDYFDDAIYHAIQRHETEDIAKWRSLRNWWERVGTQLAESAARAVLVEGAREVSEPEGLADPCQAAQEAPRHPRELENAAMQLALAADEVDRHIMDSGLAYRRDRLRHEIGVVKALVERNRADRAVLRARR